MRLPNEREIPVEIVVEASTHGQAHGAAHPNSSAGTETASAAGANPTASATRKDGEASPPPLVAPPPEPMRAETQKEQPRVPNSTPETEKPVQPDAAPSPAPAPRALAAAESQMSVAPPAKTVAEPAPAAKPSSADSKPKAPVDLGAALPMDFAGLPTSFRAVLSGSGSQASEDYKGLVFGRLGRSQGPTERARAQGLRGNVIVSFTVDDQGQLSELKIARSSGIPALDAIALDMIKEATPFPPPPPGSKRTFTPALSFGDQ